MPGPGRLHGDGKLELPRQLGAARKAEGAKSAGQLVCGGMGGLALRTVETVGGAGRGCRFQQADPRADLRQKACPELVERRAKTGRRCCAGRRCLAGLCAMSSERFTQLKWFAQLQPSTPEICSARVIGSKGLKRTDSTPRSAKRRWSELALWR